MGLEELQLGLELMNLFQFAFGIGFEVHKAELIGLSECIARCFLDEHVLLLGV